MTKVRFISSLLAVGLAFVLTGCGFVDVTRLSSGVKKTGLLFLAPSAVISDATVQGTIGSAPLGVSVIAMAEGANLSAMRSAVRQSHANIVVLDSPSSSAYALAAQFPAIRFLVFGQPSGRPALSNLIWLTVQPTPALASVAGYIAGGIPGQSKSIQVIYGAATARQVQWNLVSAMTSGVHAAFSNAPIAVQTVSAGGGAVTSAAGNQMRAFIVLGNVPSQVISDILTSGIPVIDVANLSLTRNTTSLMASLPPVKVVSAGLRLVFSRMSSQSAWPTQLPITAPVDVTVNGYSGWPGALGVARYARLLQSRALQPQAFYLSIPTLSEARRAGLPLPNVSNGGSGGLPVTTNQATYGASASNGSGTIALPNGGSGNAGSGG